MELSFQQEIIKKCEKLRTDMNRIEFSVIVPVYNVEKYIHKCVKSVLGQKIAAFELILVDDGSPDDCGKICDEYAASDPRVKVVHKKNGGLSSARNAGLEIACGKYIIFLDSDDFWDDDVALLNIETRLTESDADLLVFPAKRYYEEKDCYTYILNEEIDRNAISKSEYCEAVEYMLQHNVYRAAAWNKVIRKKIIDDHSMRFREGYLSEDMDWCGDLLLHCNKFDFYHSPFYAYRQQRKGSITAGKTEKLVADKLFMCKKGYSQSCSLDDERKRLLGSYYAYEYAVLLGVSGEVKNKELLSQMEELQNLLDFDICNKVKSVNKVRKILGYKLTRIVLCTFVKMKR